MRHRTVLFNFLETMHLFFHDPRLHGVIPYEIVIFILVTLSTSIHLCVWS